MAETNIGVNINIDGKFIEKLAKLLVSWTRNKEKGMTVYQYYKKLKKRYPNITKDIFYQILEDQEKADMIKIYRGARVDYVIINPNFK